MNAIGRMGPIGANANMSNKKTGINFVLKLS